MLSENYILNQLCNFHHINNKKWSEPIKCCSNRHDFALVVILGAHAYICWRFSCLYLIANILKLSIFLSGMMIPRLDTIENMMRVSQMVVQAAWDNKGTLLQLPHITEDMLRHFVTKRVRFIPYILYQS